MTSSFAFAQTVNSFNTEDGSRHFVMLQKNAPAKIGLCSFQDTVAWTKGEYHYVATHGDVLVYFPDNTKSIDVDIFGFSKVDYERGYFSNPLLVASITLPNENKNGGTYFSDGMRTFTSQNEIGIDERWEVSKNSGDPSSASVFVCAIRRTKDISKHYWKDARIIFLHYNVLLNQQKKSRRSGLGTPVDMSQKAAQGAVLSNSHRSLYTPSGAMLDLEIADTKEAQERGLTGRSDLALQHGMAFIFSNDKNLNFWMKDTPFALDFIFIKRDGTITAIQSLKGSPPGNPGYAIPRTEGYGAIVIAIPEGESEASGYHIGDVIPNIIEKLQ